jgi:hypothetical protein
MLSKSASSELDQDAQDLKPPTLPWWVTVVLIAAGLAVMWMARSQWFFQDEWDFLIRRDLTSLHDLLRPHTQHWSTLPIIVYRLLFAVFGLDTYLPYLGVLVALNVTVGWVVALLLRRHGAPTLVALLAGLLTILLGKGVQNIAWAFQIGFVLALLFFLLAVLVLDRRDQRGDWLSSGLLLGSMLSSGLGVPFTLASGLSLILYGDWKRAIRVALVPLAAYGAWFLAFRDQITGHRDPDLMESVLLVPKYTAHGMSAALEGLFGFGLPVGPTLLVLLAVLALVGVTRARSPAPFAAVTAMTAALLVYFTTGAARASVFGVTQAATSRYVHIGGILLLVAIGTYLFGSHLLPARIPKNAMIVGTLLLAVALFDSAVTLRSAINRQERGRANQRESVAAVLDILASDDRSSVIDGARPVPGTAISVGRIRQLMDAGSLHPLEAVEIPPDVRLEVLRGMQFSWLTREPEFPRLSWDMPDLLNVSVQQLDSACLTVLAGADEPQIRLLVDGSGVLEVRSETGGTINAFLGVEGGFRDSVSHSVDINPGGNAWLRVADTGETPQPLRIDPPPGDLFQVCGSEE